MKNSNLNQAWETASAGRWTRKLDLPLTARAHVPVEDGGTFTLLRLFEQRSAFCNSSCNREADRLAIRWDIFQARTLTGSQAAPGWNAREFAMCEATVSAYRQWITHAFPQTKRYRPEWTEKIPDCVMLQLWPGTCKIDHILDELAETLPAMQSAGVPRDFINRNRHAVQSPASSSTITSASKVPTNKPIPKTQ